MRIPPLFFLLLAASFFSAASCSKYQQDDQDIAGASTVSLKPFDTTATFTGTIPCDDCLQVDVVLNIREDGLYQLRKVYRHEQGTPTINAQMGRYRYLPETNMLILGKEIGRLKTYLIEDRNRLTFVEWQGAEAESQIQYELLRTTPIDPFMDVVKLRGLFSVSNGQGVFSECSSQVSFPINQGAEYQLMLQNYRNTPHNMNRPILVSVLGRLISEERDEIIIDQFRKFYPDRDCQGNKVTTSLTETHWQLLEIGGKKWSERSSHLAYLLLKRDRTLEGFTGCNKISGTYLLKSDVLLISRSISTRKACPGSMEGENLLVSVLDEAEAYRIDKNILELIDQNDQVLARFLAGP